MDTRGMAGKTSEGEKKYFIDETSNATIFPCVILFIYLSHTTTLSPRDSLNISFISCEGSNP